MGGAFPRVKFEYPVEMTLIGETGQVSNFRQRVFLIFQQRN